MNTVTAIEVEALTTKRAFTVCVIPGEVYFASRQDQSTPLDCHETVLRPLLQTAAEAWVYELKEGSEAFESGRSILTRQAGKFRIELTGEPIKGHELFWNAAGGKRGSIVLLFKPAELPAQQILPHCERVFIVNNPSTPHSPAAMRYVREATADGGLICGLLSRSNGMQWLSFHGHPDQLLPLFAQAKAITGKALKPASEPTPSFPVARDLT